MDSQAGSWAPSLSVSSLSRSHSSLTHSLSNAMQHATTTPRQPHTTSAPWTKSETISCTFCSSAGETMYCTPKEQASEKLHISKHNAEECDGSQSHTSPWSSRHVFCQTCYPSESPLPPPTLPPHPIRTRTCTSSPMISTIVPAQPIGHMRQVMNTSSSSSQ